MNKLFDVFGEMLKHHDSLARAPREVMDKHLLPIPLAPATWGDLRGFIRGASQQERFKWAANKRADAAESKVTTLTQRAEVAEGREIKLEAGKSLAEHERNEARTQVDALLELLSEIVNDQYTDMRKSLSIKAYDLLAASALTTPTKQLQPWDDDVALMGPDAPKWNGQIEHLIRYLLTVYKRFGNTAITADLQWGAVALHKQDAQKYDIAYLEATVENLMREKEKMLELLKKVHPYFVAFLKNRLPFTTGDILDACVIEPLIRALVREEPKSE